jgi:hypothetical protein
MADPEQPFDERLAEAQAGIDSIAEISPYSRELLLGAYASVTAIGDSALAAGTIGVERRAEIALESASRALAVSEDKKDGFVMSMMGTIKSQNETILKLVQEPKVRPPVTRAKPKAAQSAKPKK